MEKQRGREGSVLPALGPQSLWLLLAQRSMQGPGHYCCYYSSTMVPLHIAAAWVAASQTPKGPAILAPPLSGHLELVLHSPSPCSSIMRKNAWVDVFPSFQYLPLLVGYQRLLVKDTGQGHLSKGAYPFV